VLAVILQRELARHSPAVGFDHTFAWALCFSGLALVPALFLPARQPQTVRESPAQRVSAEH
jgi:hypothetical protein